MPSTFIFDGRESELTSKFNPPIELDPNKEHLIGLIDLETFNSIPNVDITNNKFYYTIDNKEKVFEIPIGQYEINDLEKYIRRQLGVTFDADEHYYQKHYAKLSSQSFFKLTPNVNTLKCSLICSYKIDFTKGDSIGELFGFSKRTLDPYKIHESDNTVDILKVNVLQIDCSIATSSYKNGKLGHILYQFFPSVPPGYKIVQEPSTIIYLPVNTLTFDTITVKVLDQDDNLVNFRNEKLTLRLSLKSI